ncbi:hypothetical protein [Streptomyces sp. NPDC003006]
MATVPTLLAVSPLAAMRSAPTIAASTSPCRIVPDALDPMCPSPELPYEVRVYSVPDGIVGADCTGTTPHWWTRAWCDRLNKAVLLADTAVAHRLGAPSRPAGGDCGDLRAEVWQHSTTDLGTLPSRVHRVDADPDRPAVPRLPHDTWPKGHPASTEPTPEPAWRLGEQHPPTYDLRVWSEADGWMTLGWIVGGRGTAGIAATLLRVGWTKETSSSRLRTSSSGTTALHRADLRRRSTSGSMCGTCRPAPGAGSCTAGTGGRRPPAGSARRNTRRPSSSGSRSAWMRTSSATTRAAPASR